MFTDIEAGYTHLAHTLLTPGLHLEPTPLGRGEVGGGGACWSLGQKRTSHQFLISFTRWSHNDPTPMFLVQPSPTWPRLLSLFLSLVLWCGFRWNLPTMVALWSFPALAAMSDVTRSSKSAWLKISEYQFKICTSLETTQNPHISKII